MHIMPCNRLARSYANVSTKLTNTMPMCTNNGWNSDAINLKPMRHGKQWQNKHMNISSASLAQI